MASVCTRGERKLRMTYAPARVGFAARALSLAAAGVVLGAATLSAGCAASTGAPIEHPSAMAGADGDERTAPPPARLAASDDAAGTTDAELGQLRAVQRELEQRLGMVERELLAATAKPSGSLPEAEAARSATELVALLERRVGLTVALRRAARSIERRRLVLQLGGALPLEPTAVARQAGPAKVAATKSAGAAAAAVDEPARAEADRLVAEAAQELGDLRARRELFEQQGQAGLAANARDKLELAQTDSAAISHLAKDSARERAPEQGVLRALLDGQKADLDTSRGDVAGILRGPDAGLDGLGLRGTGEGGGGVGHGIGIGAGLPTGHGQKGKKGARASVEARGGGAPAPDDATKAVGAAVVADNAAPPDFTPALQRHLGRMLECVPESLRSPSGLRLEVKARLGPDGGLYQPRVSFSVEVPVAVEACVVDVLARVRCPAPSDGASRVVSFPVWLATGG
jgi:hypothetical protein